MDLAFGVFEFVAALALFAMIYGVLNLVVGPLFETHMLSASGSELATTQSWIESGWVALPFIALLLAAFRFIIRSAFESRGGV